MATRAPTIRKHLSADALFKRLRTGFTNITDHRPGTPKISLSDALMSAFAMFSLKSPSLLAFDDERHAGASLGLSNVAKPLKTWSLSRGITS